MLYGLGVFYVVFAFAFLALDYSDPLMWYAAFGLVINAAPVIYGARESRKSQKRHASRAPVEANDLLRHAILESRQFAN
jgi:uncharacterized membrane protein